jgi:hypothetical protein
LNNLVRYNDPSGHWIPVDKDAYVGVRPYSERLFANGSFENATAVAVDMYAHKNDLEGLATISDFAASKSGNLGSYMDKMGETFLGVQTTGTFALAAAVIDTEICDNGKGDDPGIWSDRGFHEDFQDGHNQLYHVWGFVAQTTIVEGVGWDNPLGYIPQDVAIRIGVLGNRVHDPGQSFVNLNQGYGTSWQDYTLSNAGMSLGVGLSSSRVKPSEAGDYMRWSFGTPGPGSYGMVQALEWLFGPLRGSPPKR